MLIAVLLLFAACKGESPTAPPPGGGIPPGGSTPPQNATLSLAVSNANPLVDSSVVITATVTLNNAPVPNGTAVEFVSNGGVLNGSGTSTIKTTLDGVATVTLTSGTAGPIRVTATVNNITRQVDISFQARQSPPTVPDTSPVITSVTPTTGRPQGGEVIRITGKNFKPPVRVLFDTGGATPVEGSVQFVSDTLIEVISPPVNLGAGQQLVADIIVFTEAGSASERRADLADGFTYRNEQLTPSISTVTPNSGPVTGGTRVTIFGEGFQAPVQVLFGTAEARVLDVQYSRIDVETPAGRDTSPGGSDVVTGPVSVTVRNIDSNTTTSLGAGFYYKAAMAITAAGPGVGPITGGTRITIEGIGFLAPVAVVVRTSEGDVVLQQVSVTGTKIIALTPAIAVNSCTQDLIGPIVVTNINNGDQAEGPQFRFDVVEPSIVDVNPSLITEGNETTFQVVILNPAPGVARFKVGEKTVFPNSVSVNGNVATYTLPVPANFDYPTETCPAGGSRQAPLELDISYSTSVDGCEDTAEQALTAAPADTSCVLPPAPEADVTSPATTTCPGLTINTADGVTPANGQITIANTGNANLTITAAAAPSQFTVLPVNASVPGGGSQIFTVTFTPAGADVVGNIAFTTNDADEPSINVCVTGNVP